MNPYTIIKITALVLALIMVCPTTAAVAAISCDCGDICVNETGWWHGGGAFNASKAPIPDAVNNASSGDVIGVKAGNYVGTVDITVMHLTLTGEGADVVNVTAAGSDDYVFKVAADYVNISGFNVTGATKNFGIYLSGANHCNISDNTASNNKYYGIYLESSSDNRLLDNTISNNNNGIELRSSSNNTLTGNTVNSNRYDGIYLDSSSDNRLLTNTASNNEYGIELYNSSDNTLTGNTASNNDYGIYLDDSSDNLIYNNYWSNANNVYDDGSNRWNITINNIPNIIGGPSIGGNYWGDYTCTDPDGDGFGEEPYSITGGENFDYNPLCLSGASVKGDLNGDGDLTPADAAIALRLAATGVHNDAADVSGDGSVTSLDALMIIQAAAGMLEL